MKTLLKLGALLIIAILVYNYFYGTTDEKAQSQEIFQEVKELGSSVKDLLVEEHQKYKEGKYDDVFNKLEGIYSDLESQFGERGPEFSSQLDSLQQRRRSLEEQYGENIDSTKRKSLDMDLDQLLEDTKKLIEKKNE